MHKMQLGEVVKFKKRLRSLDEFPCSGIALAPKRSSLLQRFGIAVLIAVAFAIGYLA